MCTPRVGQHDAIGDHVVDPRRTRRAGIRKPVDLDRCRPQRERCGDAAAAIAAQIDEHVERGFVQALRERDRREVGCVVKLRGGRAKTLADRTRVVARSRQQNRIDRLVAKRLDHRDDQKTGRMIAETVRHEANAKPSRSCRRCMREREPPSQRRSAGFDRRRRRARANELLGRTRGFGKESERRDARRVLGDACTKPRRQRIEIAPVAKLAFEEHELPKRVVQLGIERARTRLRCSGSRELLLFLGHEPGLIRKARIAWRHVRASFVRRFGFGETTLGREHVAEQQQAFGMARRERQCVARIAFGRARVTERKLDRREIEPCARVRGTHACGRRICVARAGRVAVRASRIAETEQHGRMRRRDRERTFERNERRGRIAARELDAAEIAKQLDRSGCCGQRETQRCARSVGAAELKLRNCAKAQRFGVVRRLAQKRHRRGFGVGAASGGEKSGDRVE